MIRVLYTIVDLPIGGAEMHLLNLVRNLDRKRFDPVVCCIGRSGPIGAEIKSEGVPVVELGKLERGGFDREVVTSLRKILRQERISLLHSHLYHASLYGRLAARREGVPAVCTVHNAYARPKWRRRLINRWLARHTARIIAVSGPVREDILRFDGVDPSKVVVIPNGVDVERFDLPMTQQQARAELGVPAGRFVIGTLGRLEEQKGLSYLIEAVRLLAEGGNGILLLIAGSGREESRLRHMVSRFGLEDSVRFLGMRSDAPTVYRAIDVFVLPSLWEGGPITLLEAMASGLPVVATPVGFVPEVVQDGENGLIVPPRDPLILAQSLQKIRQDPVMSKDFGVAAQETVRTRYSHHQVVAQVMEIYRQVLQTSLARDPG